MFSDCRCCLITAFVGDNKLILILSYLKICRRSLKFLNNCVFSNVEVVRSVADYTVLHVTCYSLRVGITALHVTYCITP